MTLRFRMSCLMPALIALLTAATANSGEERITLTGSVSDLGIVRVFLISQADDGFEGLAGKHKNVDSSSLKELQARSKALKETVLRNGQVLDEKLCNQGAVILNSKDDFDALYVEAFRELDRANNAATAHALDGLSAAAYKFLVDELASISFTRTGTTSVQSGPPRPARAVELSCGRLGT